MKSLSSVGIGLSVVFTFLFMALMAELYYLLWWKKRLTNNTSEIESYDYTTPAKDLFYTFCWRSNNSTQRQLRSTSTLQNDNDTENDQDFLFKPFGDNNSSSTNNGVVQNHQLPQRFLFTIVEETKEDLESEDGITCKSRNMSLGDLLFTLESQTPYLTPLASPPFYTPPLTPSQTMFDSISSSSSSSSSMSFLSSSPPSKFKFLQEAEEKLKKKKRVEYNNNNNNDNGDEENIDGDDEESEESFITITVDHRSKLVQQYSISNNPSTASQVLPLSSSPSVFTR